MLGVTAFLYWWLVDRWNGLITLACAAVVFGLLRSLGRLLADLPAPAKGAPGGPALTRIAAAVGWTTPRLGLVSALAAAIVGITFIDLPTDSAEAGECAATESKSVPALNLPLPGLHLPILSVHAQPASLNWLTGSPPAGLHSSDLVYLGQASGSVVVYDRAVRKASRIPAGAVVVTVDSTVAACPGVH